jgi:hypothetical protein
LSSGFPRGPIVLEGFVGNLFRFEPRSTQEEVEVIYPTKNWFHCWDLNLGLSGESRSIILDLGSEVNVLPKKTWQYMRENTLGY